MSIIASARKTIVDFNDNEVANIPQSATPPQNPTLNMLWIDTSTTPSKFKRWNGTSWDVINDTADIRSTLITMESDIQQNADNILLRVKKSEYDAMTGQLLSDITQLQLDTSGLSAKIEAAEGDITSIEADVSGIHTTVSGIQGDVSTISQKANRIDWVVSSGSQSASTMSLTPEVIALIADDVTIKSLSNNTVSVNDSGIEIISTGNLDIAGGENDGTKIGIHSNSQQEEYPWAFFAGGSDESGDDAKFRVNHNGEAWFKDAHLSGSLDVTHNEMDEGADVVFGDNVTFDIANTAAENLIRSIINNATIAIVNSLLGLYTGSTSPEDAGIDGKYGDRYMRLTPATTYETYTYAPSLVGYTRHVVQPQKRSETKTVNTFISGEPGMVPPSTDVYGSWTSNGSAAYSDPIVTETAECRTTTPTNPTGRRSQISYKSERVRIHGDPDDCIYQKETTEYRWYRDNEYDVYYAVSSNPIPVNGDTGELDTSRFISGASVVSDRSISTSRAYNYYVCSDAEGTENMQLLGGVTSTSETVSLDIKSMVELISGGESYLLITRSNPTSGADTSCVISNMLLTVSYDTDRAIHAEYVHDGTQWQPLDNKTPWESVTIIDNAITQWADTDPMNVCLQGDIAILRGGFKLNASLSNKSIRDIIELPIQYRPEYRIMLPVVTDVGLARLTINTNGVITLRNDSGSTISTTNFVALAGMYTIK